MEKKFHLLYRVTNIDTGKEYIGIHSTDCIEDGYMGSGKLLKCDIGIYGVSSFRREVIDLFENREQLLEAEFNHVNEQYLNTANTYNLVYGGGGVNTTKSKRELFTKAIYSKKANELEIATDKYRKHDERYQYLFDFSSANIVFPQYEMGAMRKAVMRIIVDNWKLVEWNLTTLWNNSYTNSVAKKFLIKLLQYKGVYGNVFVEVFDWDGNFVHRQAVILE